MSGQPAALAGIRVLELGRGMAIPLAGMLFADHGADVVKIEPPDGDPARGRPGFEMWNRGKTSVVADLDTVTGLERVRALAAEADVVLTDLAPAVARATGLDAETLCAADARLVHCSVEPDGPWNLGVEPAVLAHDPLLLAATGRLTGNDVLSGAAPGRAPDSPLYLVTPVASYGAGLLTVAGALAALVAREGTGRGDRVSTTMVDGLLATIMRIPFARQDADVRRPAAGDATDLVFAGIALCFMTAECADGRFIQMCARQDSHFRRWLEAIGLGDLTERPEYVGAPLRFRDTDELRRMEVTIRERMLERTQDEWMVQFLEHDVPADPFLTGTEFLRHPEMVDNGRVATIDSPRLGPVRQLGPLVACSATPAVIDRPAPGLGEGSGGFAHRTPGSEPTTESGSGPSDAPLAGTTVVEFGYFLAGPQATTLLAELGARVIKVEPLAGDPFRRVGLEATHVNHGKESLAVDIGSDEGREVVRRLARAADMVLVSFRGGVAERLGIDDASLRAVNPDLVHLTASSYGSRGPQNRRAAFHSTPNALCGAGVAQGGEGNPPVDDSFPDPCSALAGSVALLIGLLARARHGQGQALETTMLTSAGYVFSDSLVEFEGAPPPELNDGDQLGVDALRHVYDCSAGHLVLHVTTDAQRDALLSTVQEAECAEEPGAADGAYLARALKLHTAEEWVARFTAIGVPAAVVSETRLEERLVATGLPVPAHDPVSGDYWRLPNRLRFGSGTVTTGPTCRPGEHTVAVLTELGFDSGTVADLLARGVAGTPEQT